MNTPGVELQTKLDQYAEELKNKDIKRSLPEGLVDTLDQIHLDRSYKHAGVSFNSTETIIGHKLPEIIIRGNSAGISVDQSTWPPGWNVYPELVGTKYRVGYWVYNEHAGRVVRYVAEYSDPVGDQWNRNRMCRFYKEEE